MPWPLKRFDSWEAWQLAGSPVGGYWPVTRDEVERDDREPREWGDPWPARYKAGILAGTMEAFWIALPGRRIWCPWQRAFGDVGNGRRAYHGEGWEIVTPAPALTVAPSINAPPYHGYVRNGQVENDCEGRQFDQATGKLLG